MREFQTKVISPSFEPGDIVVLRSGGPDMTVTEVDPKTGLVKCWWANVDGITDSGAYPGLALMLAE